MFSILLFVSYFLQSSTIPYDEAEFRIIDIENNPGIYFERLPDIRVYHTEWNLVTSIAIQELLTHQPDVSEALTNQMRRCTTLSIPAKSCEGLSQATSLQLIMENLRRYEEILNGTINGTLRRNKRGAPLSFIGSLSKTLFGTMTEDEANKYDEEISKLQKNQQKISGLLANQTHIINSEFNQVYDRLQNYSHKVTFLEKETDLIVVNLQRQRDIVELQAFRLTSLAWIQELENSVYEYRNALTVLTDAIIFAKEGHIHPAILSPSQLVSAAEKIKESTNLEFPLAYDELLSEQFSEIGKLEVQYHNRKLLLKLTVPLLDQGSFNLYHLYPCPKPQSHLNNTIFSYIIPQFQYIAVDTSRRYYMSPDIEYLSSCRQHLGHPICRTTLPLYDVKKSPSCESDMITKPQQLDWNKCDIRLLKTKATFWQHLSVSNIWLFSALEPEEIQITCNKQLTKQSRLEGTGLLQLKPGCQATTTTTRLVTSENMQTTLTSHFSPPISLNISFLTPEIHKESIRSIIENMKQTEQQKSAPNDWKSSHTAISLNQIAAQAEDIAKQEDFNYRRDIITYSSVSVPTILLIGALAYWLYRKNVCRTQTTYVQTRPHRFPVFDSRPDISILRPAPPIPNTRPAITLSSGVSLDSIFTP